MKARRVAAMVQSPEELRRLLQQFSPDRHAGLMERLRPHLTFDPDQPESSDPE